MTHKQHTERDKRRYERALTMKDSSVLFSQKWPGRPTASSSILPENSANDDSLNRTLTRSHVSSFNRDLCFYCQNTKYDGKHARAGSKPEPVHNCRSADIGISMKKIVEASDNGVWKLNMADILAEGHFLSRDIKYHKTCHTTHWQHYVQQPAKSSTWEKHHFTDENTVEFISAEIEFIAELQECLNQGDIITLNDVATLYSNMMDDYGVHNRQISRQILLEKIQQNITDFVITDARGKKPALIHSKQADRSAMDQAFQERDIKGDMNTIFQCSKIIRQAVLRSRREGPWSFDGSLVGCSEMGVPAELITLTRCILQGAKAATSVTRKQQLHNSCLILSQSVIQACKTERQVTLTPVSSESTFHNMFQSSYAVGLSLYMYHNFRSQKAVSLLSQCGAGISYDRVTKICNTIANAISKNIRQYGVYVPPVLLWNKRIRASMDNIDKKVDTPDGKSSFHGMVLAVYQCSGQGETVLGPVEINPILTSF